MTVAFSFSPSSGRVGDLLTSELKERKWTRLVAISAFARLSGVKYVAGPIKEFTTAGGRADLTIGTDMMGTTYEAAWRLMHAVAPAGRLLLASSEPGGTFHPKVYVLADGPPDEPNPVIALQAASRAVVVVGSSNLTGGGMFHNDEASVIWRPHLAEESAAWMAFCSSLGPWLDPSGPVIIDRATATNLKSYALSGRLPREIAIGAAHIAGAASGAAIARRSRKRLPAPPPLPGPPPPIPAPPSAVSPPGLNALIARLRFGSSRRWGQWELNRDVAQDFFGVSVHHDRFVREPVDHAGNGRPPEAAQLIVAKGKNRRLEFPDPLGRPDPGAAEALLVVVDRRPQPFRYTVVLPGDTPYVALDGLNRSAPKLGVGNDHTRRVVVPFATLKAVWPTCPL